MIKHLRWKLTFFNTAVTGAILVSITLFSLFVSEKNTRDKAFQNFSDNLGTVSAYLVGQDQLSVTWLQQMESAGHVFISIRDGDNPLFSMGLSPQRQRLAPEFQKAREQAKAEFNLEAGRSRTGGSCVFSLRGEGDNFAGLALIPKNGTVLELILLYPLTEIEQGIHRQRLVVCLAELAALGLLGLFSWCFTGKMLRPIQENQRRQAQFTADASHELRTPLAAILSATSAWERAECMEPAQQALFSDIIRREGTRMTRLIGDLLTLAGADSQSWGLNPGEAELDMLLLGVYESYFSLAKEKGLSLSLDLPEKNGPAVYLDKDRIIQVLSILLDNALDYTPSPGRVRLGLEWQRSSARFTVSDTGPGIPDGEKQRIFERFHRVEKARSNRSHFGLGLCIAAEIVKLHHGKLWVEDAAEGGAVFIVELPVA